MERKHFRISMWNNSQISAAISYLSVKVGIDVEIQHRHKCAKNKNFQKPGYRDRMQATCLMLAGNVTMSI